MRRVVKVSTQYTGSRKKLGKWIKPKRYVVNVTKNEQDKYGKNRAIYLKLKKKRSLKRKDFAWWNARKKRKKRKKRRR